MGDLIASDLNAQGMSILNAYYLANASKAAYEEDPASARAVDDTDSDWTGRPCFSPPRLVAPLVSWGGYCKNCFPD